MPEELFRRRFEILRFLARRGGKRRGPTIAEIARAVGLKSSQTVHHHLTKLEADGYVEREVGRPRTVRVTEKGWAAVGHTPLLGRVAAGRGIEAIADESAASLAADLLTPASGNRRYVLRAAGDSMSGARIEEDDLLLVEENPDPPNGAVIVALLRGENATVKRLYREGATVRLRPQNGEYEDIVLPAEEVTVQGEVIMVLHPPAR